MGGFDHREAQAGDTSHVDAAPVLHEGDTHAGPSFQGPGGGDYASMMAAFGHWADDHHDQQPATPSDAQQEMFSHFMEHRAVDHLDADGNKVLEAPHTQVGGLMNGLNYDRDWASKAQPEDTKLDLSTPEARMASLDHLTQQRTDTSSGEDTCAASSLVGAAILGGGTTGLTKLMDGLDSNLTKEQRARLEGKEGTLTALRDKIKKGEPITQADMHQLQADVDMGLQDVKKAELAKAGKDPDASGPGADPNTIDKFLAASPAMQKMMRDNHMGISTIDMNGGGQAHAVLAIRNPDADGDAKSVNAAVYDPYARKNGQIVTDEGSLTELRLAEKHRADGSEAFSQ